MRTKTTLAVVLALLALCAAPVHGQWKKSKSKEKRFESVAKQEIADYAGKYVGIQPDYYLEITAGAGGRLNVVSHEGARQATLRDIRVAGARLTATAVYADGATRKFEATFGNRIRDGESIPGIRVESLELKFDNFILNTIFYRRVAER